MSPARIPPQGDTVRQRRAAQSDPLPGDGVAREGERQVVQVRTPILLRDGRQWIDLRAPMRVVDDHVEVGLKAPLVLDGDAIGIDPLPAINDVAVGATLADTQAKVNELLGALRAAGLLRI